MEDESQSNLPTTPPGEPQAPHSFRPSKGLVAAVGAVLFSGLVIAGLFARPSLGPGSEVFSATTSPSSAVPETAVTQQPTLPPEQASARLSVESDPVGALVLVDGSMIGETPLNLEKLAPGRHALEVRLDGHAAWSEEVEAIAGTALTKKIMLTPLPGTLDVSAEIPGATVYLNGEARGETPLQLEGLAAGNYELRVEKEGFQPWTTYFWLAPGAARNLEAELPSLAPREVAPPLAGPALAVIVENQDDARPQSGLDHADVVYEALAEGGISRFLAIYLTRDAPVVGPVRSARHYFVSWANEFGAALAHIGASPQGFNALSRLGVVSLDETRDNPGFWRSRTRYAPHNAYASTEVLRGSLGGGEANGGWGALRFKEPSTRAAGDPVERLAIEYGWNYSVSYAYDGSSNTYLRTMAGSPHRDAETGEQIRASSVVVMEMPAWVLDSAGRLDMELLGSGRADFFLDGVHVAGSWQRDSEQQATQFLDADGKSILLNPGNVWIQAYAPQWGSLHY